MSRDRPLLGILLMSAFCVMAPIADAIAKVLGDTIPLGELLLVRFGMQGVILGVIVACTQRTLWMSRPVFWLSTLRTGLHIVGVGAMFASLRYLPLADAVAIAFVMPFILLLLGRFVLNEQVGWHRIGACIVGFAGSLLVIKPSFSEVGYPALLPLLVAVVFAFFILITRQIARKVDPVSLQASNGLLGGAVLLLAFFVPPMNNLELFAFVKPNGTDFVLLISVGVLGTVAHLLMSWALRFAPASTLAPIQYLEIPLAAFIGWWIFNDLPDGLAALGIGIIFSAGMYVVYRERMLSKRDAAMLLQPDQP